MDTRFARWTPGLIAALLVAGCATPSGGGGGSSGSPSPSSSDSSGTSGTGGGAGLPSAGTPSTPGGTTPGGTTPGGTTPGGTTPGGTTPDGGAAGRGAEVPTGTAQTPDERRAAVDRRLDESMGEFDERIRKEQEGVAKERDSRAGAGADTVAGAGEESGDATGSEAAGGKPGDLKSDRAGSGNAGEGGKGDSSGPARTSAGTGGTGKGAIERPDGSDDDIVARRLRRAAEQETDPELKEKLWKEYADYKKSVQGG